MLDRRQLLKSGLVTAATAVVGSSLLSACRSAGSNPIAKTASGRLAGQFEDDVFSFKGVPYGALEPGVRFRPATPAPAWTGVKEATQYGPSCPQPPSGPPSPRSAALGVNPEVGEAEDCLVLNVWTRGLDDGARRPVMVWLHGGGYATGSASRGITDGANLARNHDVVVVSLNHRLGPLGFLYLREIGGDAYADSGNIGSLDMVLALEWVRDNIAAFGGDPNNVTIFGQSGGAGKVTHLMCMPSARGLFHRAIMQSGVAIRSMTTEVAAQMTRDMIELCGATEDPIAQLNALPIEKLLEAHQKIQTKDGKMFRGCSPVIDGVHLFDHPETIFMEGKGPNVPVIIGSTRDELTATGALMRRLPTLTEADFIAEAEELLGEQAAQVIAGYREILPQASISELAMQFHMDH